MRSRGEPAASLGLRKSIAAGRVVPGAGGWREANGVKTEKVVVIGSGIGGAGVAALLQTRGKEVTLLERNPFAGGKCWGFEKDGFIVDSGVHMFSLAAGGPHAEIDRLVGGDLQWERRDPGALFHFRGSFDQFYYQNPANPRALGQIAKVVACERLHSRKTPTSAGNASRDRLRKAANELYGAHRRGGFSELVKTLPRLMKRDPRVIGDLDEVTTRDFLLRVTENPLIHLNFAAVSMVLLVTPYEKSSAGELFWCSAAQAETKRLGVPKGGSREIPNSWLRSFERNGGTLELGAEVVDIGVEGGRVTGVATAAGKRYPADVVVSNAGIKKTIEMAGVGSFPDEYVRGAKGLVESYSFITIKYALARNVVDSPVPCYFNVPDMASDEAFAYLQNGGVPDDPFLFIPIPTEWDARMAPVGKQLVIMGVPGPTRANEEAFDHSERILDRAEEKLFELFPRMKNSIEWSMRTHVRDTSRLTGKPTGECIGLAQSVGQTGVHKPAVKTPVDGLYLTGCDAGARGVGTEQAAASALYVAGLLS